MKRNFVCNSILSPLSIRLRAMATFLVIAAVSAGCSDSGDATSGAATDMSVITNDTGRDVSSLDAGDGSNDPTCGDRVCDPDESCTTCEIDCQPCDEPVITECNDGVDNDGDGLTDWHFDPGCWGEGDTTESSGSRAQENGWTTFDVQDDSQIIYVSNDGDDANDGLTPETSVATPARGVELVRDGSPDFLLFRRGDTWRAQDIGENRVERRFKSGRDAASPMVVSSYGDSTERPRFELDKHFIDDDGNERRFLAIVGLAFISYPRVPDDPDFNGEDGGALRFVGTGGDILIEDTYVEYGEFVIQNVSDVELRRNVVYRSYHVGTCAYNDDGSRDPNGDSTYRPSGIFAGGVDGLTLDDNVFDENGWNPDVEEACATIFNHNMYLSGCTRVRVRQNLILRASSIGVKMAANETGASNDIVIDNNLFAEGEIGLSMGGNANTEYRFTQARVRDNVFTDIGRAQPTNRNLTWYVTLSDNDDTTLSGNLFVNQPDLGNPIGIRIGGDSMRDLTIERNLFYGLLRRNLIVDSIPAWQSVTVSENRFVSESTEACLIAQDDEFGPLTYSNNEYISAADESSWFCVDGDQRSLADWQANEPGASTALADAPDPGRNLDTYAEHLGLGDSLADFAEAARGQSRHTYRPELRAINANAYIRGGFMDEGE